MKFFNIFKVITFLLIVSFAFFSCEKEVINPEGLFETNINNVDIKLSPKSATIDKGVISLNAYSSKNNEISTLVITVKGDQENSYNQEYDYKTGVSVTQCGLTYKIFSKNSNGEPEYYVSYEGFVKITSVDRHRNTVSGKYNFIVRSIPDKSNTRQTIKGSFVNIPIK